MLSFLTLSHATPPNQQIHLWGLSQFCMKEKTLTLGGGNGRERKQLLELVRTGKADQEWL